MKIYGQTDEVIVREMVEDDCGKFLELMTEHGTNEDFTVEDIRVLWEFRKEKGDLQCTITSADGVAVYGFCGIREVKKGRSEIRISFFEQYADNRYEQSIRHIFRDFFDK